MTEEQMRGIKTFAAKGARFGSGHVEPTRNYGESKRQQRLKHAVLRVVGIGLLMGSASTALWLAYAGEYRLAGAVCSGFVVGVFVENIVWRTRQ